jgi:hypothetical protein
MSGVPGADLSFTVHRSDQNGKTVGEMLASKVDAKPRSYGALQIS